MHAHVVWVNKVTKKRTATCDSIGRLDSVRKFLCSFQHRGNTNTTKATLPNTLFRDQVYQQNHLLCNKGLHANASIN